MTRRSIQTSTRPRLASAVAGVRLPAIGMLLMMIANPPAHAADVAPLTDLDWYVVNDNVMGGRSSGGFDIVDGTLRFSGRTNTNGGGFSSIRTGTMQEDLSAHSGIRLRVKGDGRRYTWRLTTDARWRGRQVGYWADFETKDGEWLDVDIPWSEFTPQIRGYRLDGPALDKSRITGMGLMIYDNLDGPFAIHLDSVSAYRAETLFSLSDHRWKNRLLILSAANDHDDDLARQLEQLSNSSEAFVDRDMMLITLLDSGTSMAGDRTLQPGDIAAVRSAMNITPGGFALRLVGKDGSVKMARDQATSMQDIFALIDTMPMRRQETTNRQ